jgi:hypothetical protein
MALRLPGFSPFIMPAAGPPAKEELVQPGLSRLPGNWQLVAEESDGRQSTPDAPRPEAFAAAAGTGQTLRVFKRVRGVR